MKRELSGNVHPADGINPTPDGRYNLVVIGAGTAGLICAAGNICSPCNFTHDTETQARVSRPSP